MQQPSIAERARKPRSHTWLVLTLVWCASLFFAADVSAAPAGFVDERVDGSHWLFPETARDQVRELQATAGQSWRQVASELAFPGAPNLTIRIGRNPEEMQSLATDTGRLPTYASGVALPERGLIFLTLTAPETWELVDVQSVLTHEMSHVALHRAVNGRDLPRWFVEGFAIDQAQERSLARIRTLWEGTLAGRLMDLDELSDAFPAHHHGVNLAYAQSADFVRYLKRGPHGVLRLSRLVAAVGRGAAFEDAALEAFRAPLDTLEREWRDHLAQRFGQWPLLLSGLTGLWFILAALLVVAYARARRRHRETLRRWGEEEAEFDRVINAIPTSSDRVAVEPPPIPSEATAEHERHSPQHDPSGVPTIHYGGEQHTLH